MTFIQANGKITSAATDSTGAKLVKTDCPICRLDNDRARLKNNFIADDCNGRKSIIIYDTIYGKRAYYPKYCPECGRKLHN